MIDSMRRSGRTTEQMKNAPDGAFYIWVNAELSYPIRLARFLAREDLKMRSPGWLANERSHNGYDVPIVLDHAILQFSDNLWKFAELEGAVTRHNTKPYVVKNTTYRRRAALLSADGDK